MQLHLNSPRKARFRETETAYPGVLVQLGERARVAMCPDRLQYILQVRDGAAWRARRFFASRAALLTQLHEVVPDVAPDAMAPLTQLPAFARDYRASAAPHAAAEAAELAVCPS
ncbi:hypothetical protein [Xanthobacter versatilis]|uniref:hypothetical protein n=1 Tax=Xanthobacter autotrophicus (strain ATCC BAA-1158 / Py2) TaxID=78245 RepID=UPI00372801D8